jgi:hypothetical protein
MTSANQTPRIITINTPGPRGIQGPPGIASSGSNTYLGDQIITGSILISGSIIPNVGTGETTSSFDLGSETAAWRDIYVSEGSIKFIKSGSAEIVLSAKDGGISIDGGSVISADGVSGQFITSKSLNTDITVKDSNNSLLMGPIEVETDKEIVVEEGSDLTIFGDIDIQNVATADTALFSISASYTDTSSYAITASYTDTSSYAITASYALNSSCSCTPFPYSGSAVITGSLVVNNGTNNVVDTSQYTLSDSSGTQSVDWENRKASDSSDIKSVDWASRLLTDGTAGYTTSVDWENRNLVNSHGGTAIDYSSSSSLFLTAGGSTLDVTKHTTYITDGAGSLTIQSPLTTISGSIFLNSPAGIYGFNSASSFNTGSTPGVGNGTAVAFAQSGANFFIYVYIGGQWRSASLS